MSVPFISGYWPVAGNPKRPDSFYHLQLPRTLAQLGPEHTYMLWESRQVKESFPSSPLSLLERTAANQFVTTEELLPPQMARAISENVRRGALRPRLPWILSQSNEKHNVHKARHFSRRNSAYTSLVSVWMAKLYAINFAIENFGLMREPLVGWADAGVSRIWKFPLGAPLFDGGFHRYHLDKISHLVGVMSYRGTTLGLSAGLLVAPPYLWSWLLCQFQQQALLKLKHFYFHDEETILEEVRRDFPDKFEGFASISRH